MKKYLIVGLLLCLSALAQAYTIIRFPNYDGKFISAGQPEKENSPEQLKLRKLIESSLAPLKSYTVSELSNRLGAEADLPDNFFLPSYYFAGIALSNPQVNGNPHFHFFPLADDYGIVVLKFSDNKSISGGALYFHRDRIDDNSANDPKRVRPILKLISDKVPAKETSEATLP